ncbi:hypothetical protein [Demequina gelatinilytica]|uniref:hypothetical protein n=1 Tax=Demequina gelatinilytica TaxID=1638980 RepID=UPI000780585B|nr:hypothetical protein [Demequina gelatinilytica]
MVRPRSLRARAVRVLAVAGLIAGVSLAAAPAEASHRPSPSGCGSAAEAIPVHDHPGFSLSVRALAEGILGATLAGTAVIFRRRERR